MGTGSLVGGRPRTVLLALALIVGVGACAAQPGYRGTPAQASSMVVGYLERLAGKAQDRGWSLLLPDSRRAYDSREQYIDLAAGADWDGFMWRLVDPAATYCEDGGVYCRVRLQVDGSVPDFLLEAPNSKPTDHLVTVMLDPDNTLPGNAWIVVYFDPQGPRGISTGGG